MNAYKAYFIFRTDLNLTPAKLAVQVGHGVDLIWENSSDNAAAFNAWLAKESGDRRKIVLKLKTLDQLNNLKKTLESDGMQCELWMVLKTRLNPANFTFHSHQPWRISVAPYFST